jgi:hypothetical protein
MKNMTNEERLGPLTNEATKAVEQLTVPQSNDERSMVNGLNESRPQLPMDVDCRSNGLTNHALDLPRNGRRLVVLLVLVFVFDVLFLIVALFVSFVTFVVHRPSFVIFGVPRVRDLRGSSFVFSWQLQ